MIERLFRGKDRTGILNKDWLYGMLDSLDEDFPRIIYKDRWGNRIIADVDKESVGQFTGLTDKNIKDIFEGDILTGLFLHSMPVNGVVAFRDGSFGLLWKRMGTETFTAFTSMCNVEYEIIGNIYDNPELLLA